MGLWLGLKLRIRIRIGIRIKMVGYSKIIPNSITQTITSFKMLKFPDSGWGVYLPALSMPLLTVCEKLINTNAGSLMQDLMNKRSQIYSQIHVVLQHHVSSNPREICHVSCLTVCDANRSTVMYKLVWPLLQLIIPKNCAVFPFHAGIKTRCEWWLVSIFRLLRKIHNVNFNCHLWIQNGNTLKWVKTSVFGSVVIKIG